MNRIIIKMLLRPFAGVLILMAPAVRLACSFGLVLGLFACLIYSLSPAAAHFPLALMLCISVGFGAAMVLYQGAIAFLLRDQAR